MATRSHPVLTDNGHVLVTGVTGSKDDFGGKTTTAAWWMDTAVDAGHFDFGVAFSPKGHRFPGPTVTGPREAAEALKAGHRRIEWTAEGSPTDFQGLADAHTECVSFVSGMAGSVFLVHDDAVTYADSDALKWATAMAGNPGPGDSPVKSVVVTQDPWDLPRKSVRTNLTALVFVGPTNADAKRYFDVMQKSAAFDAVADAHDGRPFVWSIIDGNDDVTTFSPVPEKYA